MPHGERSPTARWCVCGTTWARCNSPPRSPTALSPARCWRRGSGGPNTAPMAATSTRSRHRTRLIWGPAPVSMTRGSWLRCRFLWSNQRPLLCHDFLCVVRACRLAVGCNGTGEVPGTVGEGAHRRVRLRAGRERGCQPRPPRRQNQQHLLSLQKCRRLELSLPRQPVPRLPAVGQVPRSQGGRGNDPRAESRTRSSTRSSTRRRKESSARNSEENQEAPRSQTRQPPPGLHQPLPQPAAPSHPLHPDRRLQNRHEAAPGHRAHHRRGVPSCATTVLAAPKASASPGPISRYAWLPLPSTSNAGLPSPSPKRRPSAIVPPRSTMANFSLSPSCQSPLPTTAPHRRLSILALHPPRPPPQPANLDSFRATKGTLHFLSLSLLKKSAALRRRSPCSLFVNHSPDGDFFDFRWNECDGSVTVP